MNSGRIAETVQDLLAAILALAGCMALLGVSLPAGGQAMASSQLQQQVGTPGAPGTLEAPLMFDIPAQPLQAALERFMTITAYSGIYDSVITAGLQSTAVKGLLAPEAALQQLIAATGLSVRFAAENTFAIVRAAAGMPDPDLDPAPAAQAPEPARRDGGKAAYYGLLQEQVKNVFCRNPSTMPGTYRVALSLWIDPAGMVEKVRLLDSSGSPERDARISAGLSRLQLPPPQAGMQQPITLVLLPKAEGAANDCNGVAQSGGNGKG